MTSEQKQVHEQTKCSGFVDGICIHGHKITANYVCAGDVKLKTLLASEQPGTYRLRKQSLMPSCVMED